jgi:predicted enzyme related to lactoylglutathione lyase
MPFAVTATIPILRIFDVQKAKDFYIGFLGFTVEWEHRFDETAPLYMQISRDGCTLHLSEHHGDGTPGTYVFLRVTGLDEYHKEITSKGYKYMRPGINDTFHNSRQVVVYDPFGNRLIFDETNA